MSVTILWVRDILQWTDNASWNKQQYKVRENRIGKTLQIINLLAKYIFEFFIFKDTVKLLKNLEPQNLDFWTTKRANVINLFKIAAIYNAG